MAHLIAGGGKGATVALQTTLDAVRAIKDPVVQAQVATQLFGTQSEDMAKALLEMNPATASAAKGLGTIAGAGAKMTENMGKTTPPLEALKRSAMGTFSELAAKAIPVLTPILGMMTKLGPVIIGVSLALAGMMVVTKVAGVLSSFGALLTPMAVRMGIMTAATEAETAAQTGLNMAFLANPIVLIIAGLVALGVAFAVLWNKSETFRHIVTGAFDAVKDAGVAVWHFIQAAWNNVGKPVIDFIGSHWKLILGIMTGGLSFLITNWRDIWHAVQSVWNHTGGPVFDAIADAARAMKAAVGAVLGWLGDRFHDVWVAIKRIGGWIGDAWRAMGSALKSVWDHSIGWAFGKISGGFGTLQKTVERIASAIGRAWNRMVGPLMDVWDKISGIFNSITSAFGQVWDTITGNDLATGIGGGGNWSIPKPSTQGSGQPRRNARGGDVPLGWSTAGEEGIEYIYNSGSRQTVYSKASTNNMGDKLGSSSGLSTEQFEALLDALLGRPQTHYLVLPDKRIIAVASEEGQMLMDRAR
jgi:phage-related protein